MDGLDPQRRPLTPFLSLARYYAIPARRSATSLLLANCCFCVDDRWSPCNRVDSVEAGPLGRVDAWTLMYAVRLSSRKASSLLLLDFPSCTLLSGILTLFLNWLRLSTGLPWARRKHTQVDQLAGSWSSRRSKTGQRAKSGKWSGSTSCTINLMVYQIDILIIAEWTSSFSRS